MAFKEETTKKKIAFIQKNKKTCNFCGMLASTSLWHAYFMFAIRNAFSASDLVKLFKSFGISFK